MLDGYERPHRATAGAVDDLAVAVAAEQQALQGGIRLLQLRLPNSSDIAFLLQDFAALCESYSAQLQVNTNQFEIAHAQKMGVDFICLSPVQVTSSHPGQQTLGWQGFAELVEHAVVPVFALGGMKVSDLPEALNLGAQGIAGISEWW